MYTMSQLDLLMVMLKYRQINSRLRQEMKHRNTVADTVIYVPD